MKERTYDLDERLIDFASLIILITNSLPKHGAGSYLSGQMLRSGMAPALIYGEAHAAESPGDFIHKIRLVLKELRETYNSLRIIKKQPWTSVEIDEGIKEVNQLIAIFVKSIKTAEENQIKKNNKPSQ